jgi:hypothetical protein
MLIVAGRLRICCCPSCCAFLRCENSLRRSEIFRFLQKESLQFETVARLTASPVGKWQQLQAFENRRDELSARELFRAGSGFSRLVIIRDLPTLQPSSNECRFEEHIPDLKRSFPEERSRLERSGRALSSARFPTFRANFVRTTGRISPQAQAIRRGFRARRYGRDQARG